MAVRPLQRPRLRTENPAISSQILSPIAHVEPLPKVLARVSEQQSQSEITTPVIESEAKPSLATAGAQIVAAGQAINKAMVNTARDAAKSITDDVPWLKSWKVWAAAVLLLAVFGGGGILRNLNKKPGTQVATPAKPATKPKELATTPPSDKSKLADQKASSTTATKPVAVTKNKDLFKPTATVTAMPETLKPVPAAPRPLSPAPATEYQAQQPQPTSPRTASTNPNQISSRPIVPTEQLPAMSGNYPLPNPNTTNMASRPIISVPGNNSVTIPNNFVTQPTNPGDAHLNGMITPLPPQTLRR